MTIRLNGLGVDHRLLSLVSSSTKSPSTYATYIGKECPDWAARKASEVDNSDIYGCYNQGEAAEEHQKVVAGTGQAGIRWEAAELFDQDRMR